MLHLGLALLFFIFSTQLFAHTAVTHTPIELSDLERYLSDQIPKLEDPNCDAAEREFYNILISVFAERFLEEYRDSTLLERKQTLENKLQGAAQFLNQLNWKSVKNFSESVRTRFKHSKWGRFALDMTKKYGAVGAVAAGTWMLLEPIEAPGMATAGFAASWKFLDQYSIPEVIKYAGAGLGAVASAIVFHPVEITLGLVVMAYSTALESIKWRQVDQNRFLGNRLKYRELLEYQHFIAQGDSDHLATVELRSSVASKGSFIFHVIEEPLFYFSKHYRRWFNQRLQRYGINITDGELFKLVGDDKLVRNIQLSAASHKEAVHRVIGVIAEDPTLRLQLTDYVLSKLSHANIESISDHTQTRITILPRHSRFNADGSQTLLQRILYLREDYYPKKIQDLLLLGRLHKDALRRLNRFSKKLLYEMDVLKWNWLELRKQKSLSVSENSVTGYEKIKAALDTLEGKLNKVLEAMGEVITAPQDISKILEKAGVDTYDLGISWSTRLIRRVDEEVKVCFSFLEPGNSGH